MEDILIRRREVFFNNLLLLGLDKVSFEKKHGIPFHKDMFVLPNKKGYEVITHFLFSKLSAATGKDYNIPWPLLSKELDRMFQKTCYVHLMSFSQENVVKFPRIVPSLLSTFGSDRFYEVYLAFSSYVLSKTIKKNANVNLLSRPTISQENFVATKNFFQLSTMLRVQKFNEVLNFTYNSQFIWKTFSKNLAKCLQSLKHSLKVHDQLIREKRENLSSVFSTTPGENLNLKKIMERCFKCSKPLIRQRKSLESFFSAEKEYWSFLASEVGEKADNEFFNGRDYNICIAVTLPEDFCKKLGIVDFSSSHKDGKLSVLRFMKLFRAYSMYIAELMKKNDLNSLEKTCFEEDASAIQEDLSFIKDFNKKIKEKIIPEVEESTEKLKFMNCFDDLQEHKFCVALPVQRINPSAVKERTSHFNSNLESLFDLQPVDSKLDYQQCSDFTPEKISSSQLRFLPVTSLLRLQN